MHLVRPIADATGVCFSWTLRCSCRRHRSHHPPYLRVCWRCQSLEPHSIPRGILLCAQSLPMMIVIFFFSLLFFTQVASFSAAAMNFPNSRARKRKRPGKKGEKQRRLKSKSRNETQLMRISSPSVDLTRSANIRKQQ
ncbi:hypothetical protein MPH_01332 [Macrophomina phaseolina MS6]|uniref:Uncharacterized protein n=1 Tax=Macrophomina phaseolina (strain MS6) TaxID=1126212 RepID=K2SXP9_MACPH|nr:hypothetical protein MPH_01332 [Macrophomina phaseolina MS6]